MAKSAKQTGWMQNTWRPMMAYLYMLICFNDFALFPILWAVVQAITGSHQILQWQPLTLQNGGLFHIAMGAVLGITAYGRSQEKLSNMANNFNSFANPTYQHNSAYPVPQQEYAYPAPQPAPVSETPQPTVQRRKMQSKAVPQQETINDEEL